MASQHHMTVTDYMNLEYPFNVIADPDGGYVAIFPDLPGCMTQAEDLDDLIEMAEDARRLWIEIGLEDGDEIPLPSPPKTYSGKFNIRLPKSLHRQLVESANAEGVSLNQHVVALLSGSATLVSIERRLVRMDTRLSKIDASLKYHLSAESTKRKHDRQNKSLRMVISMQPVAA